MSWEKKSVLITGISGFVGSYLAEELLKRGANVYGIIRRRADGSKPKNLIERGICEDVTLLEGDLQDIASLANALDTAKPDAVFHLAAQSFVARSFQAPIETEQYNCVGTANLLEAIRVKNYDPVVVFAGSSEEYGLVVFSKMQYEQLKKKYHTIFPEPVSIPEVPIAETNPLRPMSPYAVSKIYGDFLMRDYYHSFGIKTVVSRAFNHEGAGRGPVFVTSEITRQVMRLRFGEADRLVIGDVSSFRDWSHVKDIVNGYLLLAEKGSHGDVYNQGSMRMNSVLSYILLSLEEAGWKVYAVETLNGEKRIENPTDISNAPFFGVSFEKTRVDEMLLSGELSYSLADRGLIVYTDKGEITIDFDEKRFRPSDVPVLMADTSKIKKLGFDVKYTVKDIIRDQLNYYLSAENRA